MGIGERFKKIRVCLGLSQPEMSEHTVQQLLSLTLKLRSIKRMQRLN
jgi:hypothetical protein